MAWIFSLSAECGSEQTNAKRFSEYFESIVLEVASRDRIQCHVEIFQDLDENWWCRISPNGLSQVGMDTPEMAYLTTELGILLYQRLQTAPEFRYALAGVEVDEFKTYQELSQDASMLSALFPRLVLAETVWQSLSAPPGCRPFSSGYVWSPYEGEVYKPLRASADLTSKLNELLTTK